MPTKPQTGFDVLSWMVEQDWCDGRIGTLGLSYGAHVQATAACLKPTRTKSHVYGFWRFRQRLSQRGSSGRGVRVKATDWALKHARLSQLSQGDAARLEAMNAQDVRDWMAVNPWRPGVTPLTAAPEYDAFVQDMWRRETFDDFWRRPDVCAAAHEDTFTDAPMVFMSSWYGPYALSATDNYSRFSRSKTGPVRLIMGPWTHGQRSVSSSGDVGISEPRLYSMANWPPTMLPCAGTGLIAG